MQFEQATPIENSVPKGEAALSETTSELYSSIKLDDMKNLGQADSLSNSNADSVLPGLDIEGLNNSAQQSDLLKAKEMGGDVKPGDGKKPIKPGDKPLNPVKPGDKPTHPIKPGANSPLDTGKPPVKPGDKPPVKPGDKPPVKPGADADAPVKPGVKPIDGEKPPMKPTDKPPVKPEADADAPVKPGVKPIDGEKPPMKPTDKPPVKPEAEADADTDKPVKPGADGGKPPVKPESKPEAQEPATDSGDKPKWPPGGQPDRLYKPILKDEDSGKRVFDDSELRRGQGRRRDNNEQDTSNDLDMNSAADAEMYFEPFTGAR